MFLFGSASVWSARCTERAVISENFALKIIQRPDWFAIIMQNDSRGKINILGSESIGYCKESSYEHVSTSDMHV
jgi:hypothetical protein